jgi:hypothetical protein
MTGFTGQIICNNGVPRTTPAQGQLTQATITLTTGLSLASPGFLGTGNPAITRSGTPAVFIYECTGPTILPVGAVANGSYTRFRPDGTRLLTDVGLTALEVSGGNLTAFSLGVPTTSELEAAKDSTFLAGNTTIDAGGDTKVLAISEFSLGDDTKGLYLMQRTNSHFNDLYLVYAADDDIKLSTGAGPTINGTISLKTGWNLLVWSSPDDNSGCILRLATAADLNGAFWGYWGP